MELLKLTGHSEVKKGLTMNHPKNTDVMSQELKALSDLLSETSAELAPGRDHRPPDKPHRPSLAKISALMGVAKDILGTLHQRTNGIHEARFVANVVKAAIEHWHPGEARDPRERK